MSSNSRGPGTPGLSSQSTVVGLYLALEFRRLLATLAAIFSVNALALDGPDFSTTSQLVAHVFEGVSPCADVLLSARPGAMTTRRIIRFHNGLMKERRDDFGPKLYRTREDMAFKYWRKSKYIYTLDADKELASTFGFTFSDYDSTTTDFETLPEEDSLKADPSQPTKAFLDRPLDKSGHGFIVEGRTYGMLREYRLEAYPVMLRKMLELLKPRLDAMPDLYDKQIINTYGGEEGLYMYSLMGFEVVDPIPTLDADGKPMWKLRASPKTIELRVQTLTNLIQLSGFDQSLVFNALQPGLKIPLAPRAGAFFSNENGRRRTINHFTALDAETRLSNKILAAKGSAGTLWGERVLYVEKLAEAYLIEQHSVDEDPAPYGADIGGSIGFHPDSGLLEIGKLDRDHRFWRNVWARKGSRVEFSWDRKSIRILETAKDLFDSRGRLVPAGSSVVVSLEREGCWQYDPRFYNPLDLSFALTEPFTPSREPLPVLDRKTFSPCENSAVSVLFDKVQKSAPNLVGWVDINALSLEKDGLIIQITTHFQQVDKNGKHWMMGVPSNYLIPGFHPERCQIAEPRLIVQ